VTATVADVMTRRVLAATEGAEFKQIVAMMRANRISALLSPINSSTPSGRSTGS